jgi:hypothetical protein
MRFGKLFLGLTIVVSVDMSLAASVDLPEKGREVLVRGDQAIVISKTRGDYTVSSYNATTLALAGEATIILKSSGKSGKGGDKKGGNDDDDDDDDDDKS